MQERLSGSEKKFIRRVKGLTREQMEVEEFRKDMRLAIDMISNSCYQGNMSARDRNLLTEYWKIRNEYFLSGDEEKYKDDHVKFSQKLDKLSGKKGEGIDLKLTAGLRIITANFAKHPGR